MRHPHVGELGLPHQVATLAGSGLDMGRVVIWHCERDSRIRLVSWLGALTLAHCVVDCMQTWLDIDVY